MVRPARCKERALPEDIALIDSTTARSFRSKVHETIRGGGAARLLPGLLFVVTASCTTDDVVPHRAGPDSGTPNGDSGVDGSAPDAGAGGDSGATTPDAGPAIPVTTKSGVVIGKKDGATSAFLAIPYAAPPTGSNRWRAPQPVTPWTAPRDATQPSKVCPQIQAGGSTIDTRSDEDCLTVNVWTPSADPSAKLPVMFWIHGGAFVFGSGAEAYYDGSKIATAGDVVVVTINYRLGALGYLALPELTAESKDHPTSGNYGIEDQQFALQWVKDNIAAFGGDPAAVTIFGESAGGFSTCAHLIAPGSKGLFVRAISESGLCDGLITRTLASVYPEGDLLAKTLGCTDASTVLTCLRGKTSDALVNAFPAGTAPGGIFYQGAEAGDGGTDAGADGGAAVGTSWMPVVDGDIIPVPVAEVGPSFQKVPLLLGTNRNEYALFTSPVLGGAPVTSDAEYKGALDGTFGAARGAKIYAEYPTSAFASADDALVEATTDGAFACPARRLARAASTAGADVYLYAFAHVPEKPLLPGLGSFHSSEMSYVFGFDDPLQATQADEQPLVTAMQGYWTRFAKTGDPNGAGAPTWPKYDAATDADLSLNLPAPTSETGHRKATCDFWDALAE
jgi:para-nitrobenzyl esterase